MVDRLISKKTAKLAKNKNFDLGVYNSYVIYKKDYVYDDDPDHPESYKKDQVEMSNFYHKNSVDGFDMSNNSYEVYSAPTQSHLQCWLRETHKIRVLIVQKIAGDFGFEIYVPNKENPSGKPWKRLSFFTIHHKTYENALEEGLYESLKLIDHSTDIMQ